MALDDCGWAKELQADCYAEAMLCTISGGHYPSGVYTVIYEGDGEIEFGKGPRIIDAGPGRIRIDVDSSRGGFSLQLKKTNPQNYVRNIRVIMPGFEKTWQQNPFHPALLNRWKGMACFRFMDWMHTNGSEVATWDDRPQLQHATFSKRGVALEWMIELCNRTQDALAVAPYMPFSIGRGKTKDLGEQMRDWNVDQLLDYFEKTAFQNSLERMDKDMAFFDEACVGLTAPQQIARE